MALTLFTMITRINNKLWIKAVFLKQLEDVGTERKEVRDEWGLLIEQTYTPKKKNVTAQNTMQITVTYY